jgi:ABC-type branched-subunit amino acid transport system substrate-binding protein
VIDSCDDQGNPNTATECAEKAVRDHVSVVTGLFIFGPNTFDVLTPAKIPVISGDPIYPVETTASNAFPISAGSIPGAAGSGWVLPHSGAKRVAVICGNAPANQAICGPAQQGVKAGGGTVIRVVTAQDGSPDYSPYVAEALSGGNVQGLVYAGTNTDLTKLFLAVQQANFKGRIGLAIATLPSLDLKTLGPEANQLLLVSQYVVPVSAATKAFTDSMAKYAKTAPINLVSEAEWASVEAAAKAMMGHPGSSAAAMMEALSSQTALNVGAYLPVLDMTKPGPLAGSPRLFSPDLVQYEVSDYKLVQVGTFFDPYAP